MTSVHDRNICLVTVTYGHRWNLLKQALESAFREGVERAVVVDNGSADSISRNVRECFGPRVEVMALSSNTGSANAFKTGLEAAVTQGAKCLLLMDDDNVLEDGTLLVLQQTLEDACRRTSPDNAIAAGFRPDHQRDLLEALSHNRIRYRRNAFLGFDILDLPFKFYKRIPAVRRHHLDAATKFADRRIEIPCAPYGAMLFHDAVIRRYGYPNPDFVVYADDTEFSHRIVNGGGVILLDTRAKLRDLEVSWNAGTKYDTTFENMLCGGSNTRTYYSVRNRTYYEAHCRRHSRLLRRMNRYVFLLVLKIMATRMKKLDRYDLLLTAIRNGEAGVLGLDSKFPL